MAESSGVINNINSSYISFEKLKLGHLSRMQPSLMVLIKPVMTYQNVYAQPHRFFQLFVVDLTSF